MIRAFVCIAMALLLGGCTGQETTTTIPNTNRNRTDNSSTPPNGGAVANGDGFALTADNTKIEFVGTHVGDKPDPRTGGFAEFTGTIKTDADAVTSIAVEIGTASLSTEIEKLTNHLKSPDFFDVRQFPQATFASTNVAADSAGAVTVTGNLTLHGVTKEISFPATVTVSEGNVKLQSSFTIDRTDFGMTFGPDKVENAVAMMITVGG